MEQETSIKTQSKSSPEKEASQRIHENTQKQVKKRMTSLKNPPSQYKNCIAKIFCVNYPINTNRQIDIKCGSEFGYVFIGGSGTLTSDVLKRYNIGAVLSVLDYKKYNKENIAEKVEDIDEVQQHQFIDMQDDNFDIGPYLDHSYNFITEVLQRNFNLLVHSSEGLSRAPAIVINYLMRKYNLKFQEAYEIVKQRKPQIQLKPILIEQLKSLKY